MPSGGPFRRAGPFPDISSRSGARALPRHVRLNSRVRVSILSVNLPVTRRRSDRNSPSMPLPEVPECRAGERVRSGSNQHAAGRPVRQPWNRGSAGKCGERRQRKALEPPSHASLSSDRAAHAPRQAPCHGPADATSSCRSGQMKITPSVGGRHIDAAATSALPPEPRSVPGYNRQDFPSYGKEWPRVKTEAGSTGAGGVRTSIG